MQDDAQPSVLEDHVGPVVDPRPRALRRQARHHPLGQPEQLQRLIDEMRTEIVPESGAHAGPLAPSVPYVRPVAIEVRFEMHDVA